MGRRKIEIRPIKDDRNRSVTFLKRKGGLFKKAYELSVLCSVDVAVIIFGNNKKLYEFSSGDIHETVGRFQYYGGAHEHKGPADFAGKGGGDDDEEEEDAVADQHESHSPPEPQQQQMMQQQQQQQQHPHSRPLQNQPGLQHMRHVTPSASPPIPNGSMPPFPQRMSTPQPPNGSRPSSRVSHFRRTSSNLIPQQQHMGTPSQPPAPPPTYAYSPNPPYHAPPPAAVMHRPPPQPFAVQAPQYHNAYPPPTQQQMHQAQQAYLQQEQRRQSSLPPGFMGQVHPGAQQHIPPPSQPYAPHQTQSAQPSPQPDHGSFQSPPLPQPKPMPAHNRSHSIFTPIDDKRSLLAQHWGGSSSSKDPAIKSEGPRSQSVDVAAVSRDRANISSPISSEAAPPPPASRPPMQSQYPAPPQRTASTSSMPGPPRPGAAQGEAKRPRLKVQIPSEQSDGGSATADSSPKDTGTTAGVTPMRVGQGVVLPPPSPSTNTVLSAGASGPPNPFARPAPPISTNPHVNREREHIETPLSALPSRVMDGNQMLPSPSSFWPDAWFGRDNNMMPSPLNFQTPVVLNGPSFRDEDAEKKRKAEEEGGGGGKRVKDQ